MKMIQISVLFMLTFFLSYQTPEATAYPPAPVPNVQETISFRQDEEECMAKAIYHEARGEPFVGQVAVAHVIINRTRDKRWPSTVCGVVYQPAQFTDIEKTKPNRDSLQWREASRIAKIALEGLSEDPTQGAFYYYSHTKIAAPWWARKKLVLVRYHNHTFLGEHNG